MLGCAGERLKSVARFWRWGTFWLLAFLGLVTGCASGPPMSNPPPPVALGDFMELFTERVGWRIAVDPRGTAHVFGVTRGGELQHIVLTPQRVISRESVGQVEGKGGFDVAIDAAGTIHLLAGNHYLWATPEGWKTAARAGCEQLVASGPVLLCTFGMTGAESGAPQRFELLFGHGGGIPFIFPWVSRGAKLGIARRAADGWVPLAVIEPESENDVENGKVFGTEDGVVHTLYVAKLPGMLVSGPKDRPSQLRYASFPVAGASGQEVLKVAGTEVPGANCKGGTGYRLADAHDVNPLVPLPMAIEGSRALVSGCGDFTLDIEGGRVTRTDPFLPPRWWTRVRLASAGRGRAHAVAMRVTDRWVKSAEAPVEYLWYSGSAWSSPVEIAPADSYDTGRPYDIASAGNERAIAVIPFRDGRLMARWVEALR